MENYNDKHYDYVNCSINDVLLPSNKKINNKIINLLDQRCIAISQMIVKISHFFEIVINEIFLKNQLVDDLDIFIRLFERGQNNIYKNLHLKTEMEIDNIWDNYFFYFQYPAGTRYPLDQFTINEAARIFKKTIIRHFRNNLTHLQKLVINAYLDKMKLEKNCQLVNNLLKYMNNKNYRHYKSTNKIVKEHEHFLHFHAYLTPKESNLISKYLIYYRFIKETYILNTQEILSFIIPQRDIKIHHAAIDTSVVEGLCKQAKIHYRRNYYVNFADDEIWSLLFDFGRIIRKKGISNEEAKKWKFDHYISTDGVSCIVRFYKYINRDNHNKINQQIYDKDNQIIKSVIGIDPGVCNIMTCVELDLESKRIINKKKLTQRKYLKASGIKKFNQQINFWIRRNPLYNGAMQDLNYSSNIYEYIMNYSLNYSTIWYFISNRKIRENKYKIYQMKNKIFDDFAKSIIKNRKDIKIACGKNVASASNKNALEAIKRQVGNEKVSMIDEYNTSKVCHECFNMLDKSGSYDKRGIFIERHDQFICSNKACSNYIINRDYNAAINMVNKVILSPIPINLTKRKK